MKPANGFLNAIFFFKDNEGSIVEFSTDSYYYNSDVNNLEKVRIKILKESLDYKITYYNQDSEITFVTFNGVKTTRETPPFGLNYIIKNGWNLISVAQKQGTQYQGLSLENFYDCVSPIIVNKKTFCYGSSLGGYCALYFGGCINATIIAASPKNSAHPYINLPKFKDLTFTHKFLNDIPVTYNEVYIVYDPTINIDSKFISDCISLAYPSPNLLPIEHGTHMVLHTMLKSNVLKLYINSIVYNKYNSNLTTYIIARCKYVQGKCNEAFTILEKNILESIDIS